MRTRRRLLPLALLLAAAPAWPQSSAEEQARGLLEDARKYRANGQNKQALDNLTTITTGFANTDSVDDAYLEIGRYYLDVEHNVAKARENFEQVAKRFPQGDAAPGAYYYLGWMTLSRAATSAELDDAIAQFDRVRTLYPRSDWVPTAFYAAGIAQRRAGRLPQALDAERRVALEYPTSDAAAPAQFQIGHCLALLGEPRQAMEEYQQVRNRFGDSEWAARALDRITGLYRLYGGPAPTFALDPAYNVGSGDVLKDVRALLMDPGRTLWVASDKTRSVIPFDKDGKMGGGFLMEDLRSLTYSPKGELISAARLAVRLGPKDLKSFATPPDKPGGVPEPLDRITAAVVTPGGSLLVADEKRKRVYRYSDQFEFQGPFPDPKEREVSRMIVDGEGEIVLLDRDERTVRVYDETGRLLRTVGGKGASPELRHPVDVAADAARNLYIADEEGGVQVISPQGKLLTTIGAAEARKPKAITLDPSGALLVYDERAQRILRFK
jgi:TolA-binding protein